MRNLPTRALPALPAPATSNGANGTEKALYLPDIQRLLPQAPDAEKGLLCSFFLAPIAIGDLSLEKNIRPQHFHIQANGVIFSTLMELHRDNEPIDIITVTQLLRDRNTLDKVGGAGYVTDLLGFLPTAANAAYYIEILQEKYTLREFIKTCTEGASRGYELQDDVRGLLGSTVDSMLRIVKLLEGNRIHTRSIRDLVMRSINRLDARVSAKDWKIELPTGIKALDEATMGFTAPMVTAVCGKPSDGKSSLALNIAEELAIYQGKKVGIISLDDSDDQVTDRLIQSMARVSFFEIKRTGKIHDDDYPKIQHAAELLAGASDRLFIRDDGGLTPAEISATLATWKAQHGLDFAIIDHIQLARPDTAGRGRTEDAEQISRTLKPMAKRFEIPLLVLSQVTEGSDGSYRTKNSQALAEDANNVWAISRVKESTDAWINISKQKDGPRNENVPVTYHAYCTRFSDRAKREPDQPELVQMPPPPKRGKK